MVIALDCGIRAIDQIDYANRKSIDVIICDHHNPSEIIPNAIAILNPKQIDCPYPYKELSGCGVGFKLIHAYSIKNNISINQVTKYLDLVAVSIAADIVPVNGENRVLAYYGLKKINSNPCTGLKALINEFQKSDVYTMSDLVFKIAPRINAAGRIAHAKKAVEILIEEEYTNAKLFAAEIELNNNSRKDLDKRITKQALTMIDENKKSTVVYSKNWHKGVVGIVASVVVVAGFVVVAVAALFRFVLVLHCIEAEKYFHLHHHDHHHTPLMIIIFIFIIIIITENKIVTMVTNPQVNLLNCLEPVSYTHLTLPTKA